MNGTVIAGIVVVVVFFAIVLTQIFVLREKIGAYDNANISAKLNLGQRYKETCGSNINIRGLLVDVTATRLLNTTTTAEHAAYVDGKPVESTFVLPHVCSVGGGKHEMRGVEVLCRQVFFLVVQRTPGAMALINDDMSITHQFYATINGITFLARHDKLRRMRLEALHPRQFTGLDVVQLYAIKSRRNTMAAAANCVMNLVPFVGVLSQDPPETISDMLTYLGCVPTSNSVCMMHVLGFHTQTVQT
ncbi:hypothetical protein FOA52_004179 [Chlamydomonas sp. UWO 241]|nr:hypothetical protein FOA52_004179 [Chlamydomonas sp. UWO 241]